MRVHINSLTKKNHDLAQAYIFIVSLLKYVYIKKMNMKDLKNFVSTEKDLFIIDSLFSIQELVHANLLAIPEEALQISKNIFDVGQQFI